jgi:hypothetical protein
VLAWPSRSLNAGDIDLMLERVGGGCGPERVDVEPGDIEAGCPGVVAHHLV